MNDEIIRSLKNLEEYVRTQEFKGFDPYDALNSEKLSSVDSKLFRVLVTQSLVYSPINFRNFFQINKEINPKALGLFLSAYCNMNKANLINQDLFDEVTTKLVKSLMENASEDYSGYCWGFNFNWQDIKRDAKKFTPTLVVSTFVGNGLLDLYDITKERKYFDVAKSITKFIINDLNIRKTSNGICFSYTPIDDHVVHNANCLGAAYLARVWNIINDENLLDYSKKAFSYSLSRQNKDGSWEFQYFPETGFVRKQLDFHQGFIIDSLCDFIRYTKTENEKYANSLKKAANFYQEKQFKKNGQAKWRLPYPYPVDIHHQAQGIISFSKMYEITKDEQYLQLANRITKWTIDNMQDKKGYFYYQKWPFFLNKIEYMRWGQAWMIFALLRIIKMNHTDNNFE